MSIWDWVHEYEYESYSSDDPRKQRLGELRWEAELASKTDPYKALALREQGRALAEELEEPWWVLFFDHWRLQSLIHNIGDLKSARELAVKALVEARKPIYRRFPQRVCLYEEFIWVHLRMDFKRYEAQIRDALDYMKAEIEPGSECESCIHVIEAHVSAAVEDYDSADKAALRLLALTDHMEEMQQNHDRRRAYFLLSQGAYRKEEWKKLYEWSTAGLNAAGQPEQAMFDVGFILWLALAVEHLGDHERANDLCVQATSLVRQHNLVPGGEYFRTLSDYHIARGELELALETRQRQLTDLDGKQDWAAEYSCRSACLRLLAQLGEPLDDELKALEALSKKLQDPDPPLNELREFALGASD